MFVYGKVGWTVYIKHRLWVLKESASKSPPLHVFSLDFVNVNYIEVIRFLLFVCTMLILIKTEYEYTGIICRVHYPETYMTTQTKL